MAHVSIMPRSGEKTREVFVSQIEIDGETSSVLRIVWPGDNLVIHLPGTRDVAKLGMEIMQAVGDFMRTHPDTAIEEFAEPVEAFVAKQPF